MSSLNGPVLRTKPKFIRLHTILGIEPALARGLLEFLWDSVSDTGDAELGDAEAVEAAAGWTGEAGKLCEALLNCGGGKAGFIEAVPGKPGIYRLHDLLDNSPDEQVRRWCRRQARAERGRTILEFRNVASAKPPVATQESPTASVAACAELETPVKAVSKSLPRDTAAQDIEATPIRQASSPLPGSPFVLRVPLHKSPNMPTLVEVSQHLARYGFNGNPADFLLQYRPDMLPPKEAADWKVAAVEWLRRERSANETETDRLLAAPRR